MRLRQRQSPRSAKLYYIAVTGLCIVACMALLCTSACTCFRSSQQVAEATKDGLYLRLTTDKHIYEQGERVIITARVENRSSEPVDWEGFGGDISLYVRPPEHLLSTFRVSGLGDDGAQYHAITELQYTAGTLNAGESISRETFWDQTLALEADPKFVQLSPDE